MAVAAFPKRTLLLAQPGPSLHWGRIDTCSAGVIAQARLYLVSAFPAPGPDSERLGL